MMISVTVSSSAHRGGSDPHGSDFSVVMSWPDCFAWFAEFWFRVSASEKGRNQGSRDGCDCTRVKAGCYCNNRKVWELRRSLKNVQEFSCHETCSLVGILCHGALSGWLLSFSKQVVWRRRRRRRRRRDGAWRQFQLVSWKCCAMGHFQDALELLKTDVWRRRRYGAW